MASTKLGVPVASLTVDLRRRSPAAASVKYGDLIGGKMFNVQLTAANSQSASASPSATPGQGIAKPVSQYKVVGKSFPRIDIPAKVAGTYTYIQNVRVPGMVHARVVRPRGAGANTSRERPAGERRRQSSIKPHPGRPGRADRQLARRRRSEGVRRDPGRCAAEGRSGRAIRSCRAPATSGAGCARPATRTRDNPARYTTLHAATSTTALAGAAKTVSATYKYHYNGFMPIGPHARSPTSTRRTSGDDLRRRHRL